MGQLHQTTIRHFQETTPQQHINIITDVVDRHISLKITRLTTFDRRHFVEWNYFEPGVRLVFNLKGRTHLRFGKCDNHQDVELGENEGVLLPINQKTLGDKVFYQGEQVELVIFCNYFCLEKLGVPPSVIKACRNSHLLPFTINMESLKGRLDELMNAYQHQKTTQKDKVVALMQAVLTQVFANTNTHQISAYRITKASNLLQTTAMTPDINTLAKLCLTNRTTLQNEFRAAFGVSVARYGREYRLYLTFNALRMGMAVCDAAYLAGYDNPECFSKAFKQFFGRCPSKFR